MSNKKKIFLIGNAHIDPVWLWRWQEGYAEIKATFRSALDRMKEFPEFIFTCACAAYYQWVEENAPEIFNEIKERVKEGRWVIVGGWWIQADCNIPCGESFVRQALYSQRYFYEKFQVYSHVGYNVDSFGHNAMLPQILKKSGMDYYVFTRPMDDEKELPGNLFWWESSDGSKVLAFKIPFSYNLYYTNDNGKDPILEQKLDASFMLAEEQNNDLMCFYGVGNHGGGPTISNLNLIRSLRRESGEENLIHSSPNGYFNEMCKVADKLPIVKDELQYHSRGCYSAHSEIKAINRKAEHRLMAAEKFSVVAYCLENLVYPYDKIQNAWQKVLFNQFHDIMGGCSIKEAYVDARESYGEALNIGAEVLNSSLQKISWSIDTSVDNKIVLSKEKDWRLWEVGDMGIPLVIFNPLSWDVKVPVHVNKPVKGITDENGNKMEIQSVRAAYSNMKDKWDTLFIGTVPSMGYRVYWIYNDRELQTTESSSRLITSESTMENEYIKIEIDKHSGYIKTIYDKKNDVYVLKGLGAVPIVIDEFDSDTWSHGIYEFHNEIGKFGDAIVKLVENGPVRAMIRVTNRYNDSILQQDFMLFNDRPDIEIRVKLDWREKHKMLKLSFPVNLENAKATYEIPYGFIDRPVNGEEQPGQQWLDISGNIPGKSDACYGFALLNDSKYSFDVKDNDLRMTVVRSPIFADHFAERDELCEFMDQGIQEFKYVLAPHTGEWKDAGIVKKAYELNVPPIQITETYHKGPLPQKFEGVRVSAGNIIVTVFKKAEDGDDYILRCYDAAGRDTTLEIEIPMLGRKWQTSVGKCEIKTFRIPADINESVIENNLLEL